MISHLVEVEKKREGYFYDEYQGKLGWVNGEGKNFIKKFLFNNSITVSKIEYYMQNSQHFFFKEVLNIKESQIKDKNYFLKKEGQFYHRLLEEIYQKEIYQEGFIENLLENEKILWEIVEICLKNIFIDSKERIFFLNQVKIYLVNLLQFIKKELLFIQKEWKNNPKNFLLEHPFEYIKKLPKEFINNFELEKILIEGRIDKIMINHSKKEVWIIDYKKRNNYLNAEDMENQIKKGRIIQPFIYLEAVYFFLKKKNLKNYKYVFFFYYILSNNKELKKISFSYEDHRIDIMEKNLYVFIMGLARGDFFPYIQEYWKDPCQYCFYSGLCRMDKNILYKKKKGML